MFLDGFLLDTGDIPVTWVVGSLINHHFTKIIFKHIKYLIKPYFVLIFVNSEERHNNDQRTQ
jgi:uncharacterized membrane protein AbrB (regulator of aidB expression)